MDKNKESGLAAMFNKDKSTADSYKAPISNKHSESNKASSSSQSATHHVHYSTKPQENNKSINKSRKPKKSTKAKKQSKPSYSNIRTNTNVVDELKGYQIVNGDKSRSDLLAKMIKMCKPIILNSPAKKKKYHKTMKLIKISRKLKE